MMISRPPPAQQKKPCVKSWDVLYGMINRVITMGSFQKLFSSQYTLPRELLAVTTIVRKGSGKHGISLK